MSSGQLSGGGITLQFDAEWPSGVGYSKNAEWTPVSPISRSCPLLGYSSSGSGTVAFTIRLSIEGQGSVMDRVRQLRQLVEPKGYRPPEVNITIDKYIDMRGVVASISDQVPDDAAWIDGNPTVVDVTFSILECKQ